MQIRHFLSIAALVLNSLCISSQPIRFFNSDRDISNSMVTSIRQDAFGFMWIATEDGLNRFDGLNFTTYRNIPSDSTSLMSNFVRTLFVDRNGTLWIGLINGLLIYDPFHESFREIPLYRDTIRLKPHVTSIFETNAGDILVGTSGQGLLKIKQGEMAGVADMELKSQLSSEFIEAVFQDFYGRLWIGTENKGVNMHDPTTGKMHSFQHLSAQVGSISCNYITSITEDYRKNIYIGTINGGLNRFNENTRTFEVIPTSSETNHYLPIKSVYADSKNNLWIGTIGKGLWQLNNSRAILEQTNTLSTRFDLNKSKIHAITSDHEGNLWLGVYLRGVMMIAGRSNRFNTIAYQQFGQKGIGLGCIMAIAEDKNNNIWIGTDTEGFYRINHHTKEIVHHRLGTRREQTLPYGVRSIFFDSRGRMWIGTSLDGFFNFDPETGRSRQFKHNPRDPNSLSNDKVQCFAEDKEGNLWIGTSGGGVNEFNPETGNITRHQHNPLSYNTICNNWVNTIFVDGEGLIWIGTYNRISVFNPTTQTWRLVSVANGLLPNNVIFYITEDSSGYIWIGTNDGLVRYDKTTSTSRFFTTSDGLTNNVVTAILEGDKGQMWISTHNGVSMFSPEDDSFQNFYVYDGLQGNEFRRNSALRNRAGELFFGGINGFTWFVPGQITRENRTPKVYISNLYLLNKPVQIGEKFDNRKILPISILKTDTIRLASQHNNFSLEFSTIGFNNPERITYKYRLVGFDNKWITTGSTNRRVTYTNLEPGKYIFEIKVVDNENVSDVRQVYMIISPPWWATWWFRLAYMMIGALLIYSIYAYIKNRIKLKHEKIEFEHQKNMSEAKLRFFTNISHEIRTPLTLITEPLRKLMSENKENYALMKNFQIMAKNSGRLNRLVDQLLDVRKIEQGEMIISYSQINLIRFIEDIMEAFDSLAIKKNIKFSLATSIDSLQVWIDPDNFDKVVYNVLSNAFKYTPLDGEIKLTIKTGIDPGANSFLKEYAEISISDTGMGISDDKLEKIFDRFYQEKNEQIGGSGTGIGLHLSRSFVKMQHGIIFAQNRTDRQGSIFIIRIPLGSAHIANAQIKHLQPNGIPYTNKEKRFTYIDQTIDNEDITFKDIKNKKKTNYKVLLIDNDEQMRLYLQNELSADFKVITCANGKDALDTVHNKTPDLLITDLTLPVMDGITLCRKLKSNPLTSHLPLIIISSKTQDEFLDQSLHVGVDAFFTKPFQTEKLRMSITNLLQNRERIKTKYAPGGNVNVSEKIYISADQSLMDKVLEIIEKRISDPTLNAGDLSRLVGMSRVHLFRRLKKITGQAPSDFIRKIRLQKAAQLLDWKTGFVKEIAFEVGFTSLSYFSRCFHEFYGIKPREYANREKEKHLDKAENAEEVHVK